MSPALPPSGVSRLAYALTGAFLITASPARGADAWSTPSPGVDLLHRTVDSPRPQEIVAAWVDLCESGLVARATTSDERRQTTSAWAADVGAEVAVNGAFFSYTDYATVGVSIGAGEPWPDTSDWAHGSAIAFASHGRAELFDADVALPPPGEDWWREMVPGDPVLVDDGVILTEDCYSHMCERHPRTAVGLSADGRRALLVAVDGRSSRAAGMTRAELAALMVDLGAHRALNLDGGGSTTLWTAAGGVENRPSDGSERVVASHLGFVRDAAAPGCCTPAPVDGAPGPFGDLPADHPARPAAETLLALGITAGCQADPLLYCPECVLDRGTYAVLLQRALGLPASGSASFPDLPADDPRAGSVAALADAGLTSGCGGGLFCPDRLITRWEGAVLLARGMGLGPAAAPDGRFTDLSADEAAWIEPLADACVVDGCGDGAFCPDDPLSRAEAALLLVRGLQLDGEDPCGPDEAPDSGGGAADGGGARADDEPIDEPEAPDAPDAEAAPPDAGGAPGARAAPARCAGVAPGLVLIGVPLGLLRRRRQLPAALLAALVLPVGLRAQAAPTPAAGPTAGPEARPSATARSIERSVVRLTNTRQRADWSIPWNPGRPAANSGSGFVIAGGRILTNAHVVADSKDLVLHLHGDANPHPARIIAIGHDCDLALVEPVDPTLLRGLAPLPLGALPTIGAQVEAVGYPAGGRWLSSTRGVISRFDVIPSVHSPGDVHLAVQTDAAINPGNSGGPVLHGGEVVGVAFQGAGGLENVGYFIPPVVVQHFLDDVDRGDGYQGFPALDVKLAILDAPAARRRAGMAADETGVQVDFVHPASPAMGVLRRGDVLLSLDGEPIANDGTFAWGDQRLQLPAILDRFHVGERARARVLRAGERIDLEIPLGAPVTPRKPYETLPSYVVYAGLVFVPLEREHLAGTKDPALLYEHHQRQLEHPDAPLPPQVLLLRRLEHPVNATLPYAGMVLVSTINDQPIRTLDDVVAALKGQTGDHHVIEFRHADGIAVLDRATADAAHPEILRQYGVPAERRP